MTLTFIKAILGPHQNVPLFFPRGAKTFTTQWKKTSIPLVREQIPAEEPAWKARLRFLAHVTITAQLFATK